MKKLYLLAGITLCSSLPLLAMKQGEVTTEGWYEIRCTACTAGNNGLVGKTIINADVPFRQNDNSSYSLRVLDAPDPERPARSFIYIRPMNNSWAYRSSNGHWISFQVIDKLEPETTNMVQSGYDKEIGDWAVYNNSAGLFVGGTGAAHNEFDITEADVTPYDIWTVTIGIESSVTPPCDRPYVDFTGEKNKGCYRAYDGGTYFVAAGTELEAADFAAPAFCDIEVDNEARTVVITDTRDSRIYRIAERVAPLLELDGDEAVMAKAQGLIAAVEGIEAEAEAMARVGEMLSADLYNHDIRTQEGGHPYFCKDDVFTHSNRYTPAVRLSDNLGTEELDLVTTQTASGSGRRIFHNLCGEERKFTTTPGATVVCSPQNTNSAGAWMQKKVFVDWDHSGTFDYADPSDPNMGWFNEDKTLKSGRDIELVAFDRCCYHSATGTEWVRPTGDKVADGNDRIGTAVGFVVPADVEPGEYYCRYIVDWDTFDPAGNPDATVSATGELITNSNNMKVLGGVIIDFKIVIRPAVDDDYRAYASEWVGKLSRLGLFGSDVPDVESVVGDINAESGADQGVTLAVDRSVSRLVAERLDGRFVTIRNVRSDWYLHSLCDRLALKPELYVHSLWQVTAPDDDARPFTFHIRSVSNTGWMRYDSRAGAALKFRLTHNAAERTAISLRPFGPGSARDHFYISGPEATLYARMSQQVLSSVPHNETMVTGGDDDDGSVWIVECVDELPDELREELLSRFADDEEDTESLNRIRPTAEIMAARQALEASETIGAGQLVELMSLTDNGLNQPRPGRYYRLALSDVNKLHNGITDGDYYLSNNPATVNGKSAVLAVEKQGHEAETIFYLVPEGVDNKLVAYSGYYVKGAGGEFFHVAGNLSSNVNAPKVEFPRAGTTGPNRVSAMEKTAYNIVLAGTRYTHMSVAVNSTGAYAGGNITTNACSESCSANHNFHIEQVNELPVAIHADLCGAVYLPVQVSAPEGCVVFTASVRPQEDGRRLLVLSERDDRVIPAYTPAIIRAAEAGTVMVDVDYAAEAVRPEGEPEVTGHHLAAAAGESDRIFVKSASQAAVASALSDDAAGFVGDCALFERASGMRPANAMYFTSAANASMISVPLNSAGSASSFGVDLASGDSTLGIDAIAVVRADGTETIFDLQGRRLARATRGVSIINGKKVLVM